MKIVLRSARALVFAVAAIGASAQEVPPEVQSVALEFLRGIEEGSLALGDSSSILASRARSAMAEGAFRSAGERLKAELGTARSRDLIFSTPLGSLPDGAVGRCYLLRYRGDYSSGRVLQEVFLEYEDGLWKIVAMSYSRLPDGMGR